MWTPLHPLTRFFEYTAVKTEEPHFNLGRDDVRELAVSALLQIFEPLIGFVIDAGLSTNDLYSIARHAAVRRVAAQQLEASRRINISGIAATTGIPRSEISRILKITGKEAEKSLILANIDKSNSRGLARRAQIYYTRTASRQTLRSMGAGRRLTCL